MYIYTISICLFLYCTGILAIFTILKFIYIYIYLLVLLGILNNLFNSLYFILISTNSFSYILPVGTSTAEEMPEELNSTSQYNVINQGKTWMIWFLRTHGFYGVLIMASYPNIAFDLCGICCGHFLMPFWTFFGATFLGKAVIRNGYQSIIYVMLCRYRRWMDGWMGLL